MNKLVLSALVVTTVAMVQARCCHCVHHGVNDTPRVVRVDTQHAVRDARAGVAQTAAIAREDARHVHNATKENRFLNNAKEHMAHAKDAVEDAASRTGSAVKKAAVNAGHAIKNTAQRVSGNIKEGARDVKDNVKDAKDNA